MPSKEEAERMADAILAAARAQSPRRAKAATATSVFDAAPAPAASGWIATVMAGAISGGIVAALPSHSVILGALVGVAIAACIAVIARRFSR